MIFSQSNNGNHLRSKKIAALFVLSSLLLRFRRYKYYEPLGNTFEERAGKVYGYQVDQNYWNADSRARKKRVVIYCIIWAVFGATVQISLVRYATKRQQKQDKERLIETTRHLERKQKEALSRPNLKEKENGEYDRLIELYKSKSVSRE